MASITKGRAFVSGETVTPTKLNELVDLATISNIATGDIANGAITNIKIAAVDAGKVTTGTLSVDRIANNSLPLTKLAAGALPSTVTVNSDNITNLSVVDADIANAANINDTKLATISTGGKVANSATTATSANTASAIVARDGSGNFSAGAITASAIMVSGAATLSSTLAVTGAITASGDLLIADKIVHTGDTNTAIRFPANDTVTVETAGVERLRVASSGYVGVNESSPAQMIHVSLSDFPGIALDATGEGTNEKICDIINNGGALELRLVNDAYSNASSILKADRSGFDVSNVRLFTGNTVERLTLKSGGQLRFVPLAADPGGAEAGDVYYNSGDNKLKVYNGSSWVNLH
jgi:hypothetical protein